jgi:membrane-bound metal-dependent hydrolase YbcI (DUF457 family)
MKVKVRVKEMAELLTHVLIGYILACVGVWSGWLPNRFVPVVMIGSIAPDIMRVSLLFGGYRGTIAGIPYSAWGIHTLGGAIILSGIGTLTIWKQDRLTTFVALTVGSVSHLILDLLVIRVDGVAPPYLFPITGWFPPAGNLYASSDIWVTMIALTTASLVWGIRSERLKIECLR